MASSVLTVSRSVSPLLVLVVEPLEELEGVGLVKMAITGHGPKLKAPTGPIDCGNSGTTRRLLAGALAGLPLRVVVNCAGVIRRGAEHEPEAFAEVLDINLTGTMRVCAAARPGLKVRGLMCMPPAESEPTPAIPVGSGYSTPIVVDGQRTRSLWRDWRKSSAGT